MNEKKGDQNHFRLEKRLEEKENGSITYEHITPVDGFCHKIIDSSDL